MKSPQPFFFYINSLIPYYYCYLIPVILCLIVVSFDFQFHGIFTETINSTLSSKHKFINDFFAICSYSVMILIFFNYFRLNLDRAHKNQLRLNYRKLTTQQQSLFGFLGLAFLIFILFFFCISWLFISDTLPSKNSKGYFFSYITNFAHPYISVFAVSLQYLLIVFFTLYFVYALNMRKYS